MNVKIVTDSNSGILQAEAKELGIVVIPMPFSINAKEYEEEINITRDEFFNYLEEDANVSTSQPSEYYLQELFKELLNDADEVLYIPMSSGLSRTCENAILIANKFKGKVEVVDNLRISLSQKASVLEAIAMAQEGKSAKEIKEYLEETKDRCSIYICLNMLKYLKKGGRITPVAAAIGDTFHLKPVLTTNGGRFEKFAICRTLSQAKKAMIEQIKKDLNTVFKKEYQLGIMTVAVAHTQNLEAALEFKKEIISEIPNVKFTFVDPLSLSVSCHIGPGALAVCLAQNKYIKG